VKRSASDAHHSSPPGSDHRPIEIASLRGDRRASRGAPCVSVQAIAQNCPSLRGRTVDEWKLYPGRENHLLNCCVMATVAASAAGITAVDAEASPERQRRRVEVPKPGAQRKTIATRRAIVRARSNSRHGSPNGRCHRPLRSDRQVPVATSAEASRCAFCSSKCARGRTAARFLARESRCVDWGLRGRCEKRGKGYTRPGE
jgi:hypothetical protein